MEPNIPVMEETALTPKPDYAAEITRIVKSPASPNVMRERLEDYHEKDIAEVLPKLTSAERKKLYRILDADTLANILERLENAEAAGFLSEMDLRKGARTIESMETDAATEILSALDRKKKSDLLECMDEASKKELALMQTFDDDEIGSKMTTNYISVRDNLTVKQAMSALIEQAAENDNISTLFVRDKDDVFCGAIDLKELIIARPETDFHSLIMTSYPYVYGHEDIDDCLELLKDYSEDLIPVLDNNNHLLGVITSQNMVQVVDDEMGEDYARLAEAAQNGDQAAVDSARKALMAAVRTEARRIGKYIAPPHTTDFAVMFLPLEGLYAEVMQHASAVEAIQREQRVLIAGPSTLLALLNSLQMGFRTLAIEQRSAEVWKLLGAVKADFGSFATVLKKTQEKLQQATDSIDTAFAKTRVIEKRLRRVEAVEDAQAQELTDGEEEA